MEFGGESKFGTNYLIIRIFIFFYGGFENFGSNFFNFKGFYIFLWGIGDFGINFKISRVLELILWEFIFSMGISLCELYLRFIFLGFNFAILIVGFCYGNFNALEISLGELWAD